MLVNPVLGRELKERARGWRMAAVLFFFLALLAGAVELVYWSQTRNANDLAASTNLTSARTGRLLFDSIVIGVLLLVCFLVPAFTAASIAGERDRQTLIPLQVTMLSARSIVVGKLLAGLALVTLLLVATAPFLGVALILGGVTGAAIAKGLVAVLVTAVVVGSLSLACSGVFRRVQMATVAAYGVTLFLLVGTFVGYGVMRSIDQSRDPSGGRPVTNRAFLVANPLVATADFVADRRSPNRANAPLQSIRSVAHQNEDDGIVFGPNGQPLAPGRTTGTFPFWLRSLLTFVVISLGALAVAERKLRTPAESGDR